MLPALIRGHALISTGELMVLRKLCLTCNIQTVETEPDQARDKPPPPLSEHQ